MLIYTNLKRMKQYILKKVLVLISNRSYLFTYNFTIIMVFYLNTYSNLRKMKGNLSILIWRLYDMFQLLV